MSVTIYNIAQHIGLSKATVADCLSERPHRYSEQTKRRVRDAAEKLGYRPGYLGRALVGARTNTVGIITDSHSPLSMAYIQAAEMRCHALNLHPFVMFFGYQLPTPAAEELLTRQVDGVVVHTHGPMYPRLLEVLHRMKGPVVYVRVSQPGAKIVVPLDYQPALRAMAAHLRGLGHRSVTGVWFKAKLTITEAYERAFAAEDLPLAPWTYPAPQKPGESHNRAAYETVLARLRAGDVPTAICTIDDEVALAVIRAVRDAGLRVPEDVSVVGKDNQSFTEVTSPPLSTIGEPNEAMGDAALDLLNQLINGEKPGETPRFDATFISRHSTGPCRVGATRAR